MKSAPGAFKSNGSEPPPTSPNTNEVPARVADEMAPTASFMTPNARATNGTLISSRAVSSVATSPIAACRHEIARRFSPRAHAIASSAKTPNADWTCCMFPAFPEDYGGSAITSAMAPGQVAAPAVAFAEGGFLATSYEWHLGSHDSHEQHIGVQRECRHVGDRVADRFCVHARLRHFAAVGLQHPVDHAVGHGGCGIADIDLPDRDVIAAAIQVGGLG